ncbi:ABC transporter permease family protein [Kineosporia babensis]|uniref:FtsX-like permease family protein n=1 Tax=Kineosporia babensis TaxID=499548 RepID=A0A9X1SYI0_9ACTN|nr:FtsX-like permease family protein [Kineosporia babensis]MCD5310993.1 hypothetical protein [Kineosporia babensis]
MLRLLRLRAAEQVPLLSAVLVVVTIGATLLGTCALLLTVSQTRALTQGLPRALPQEISATAYVTDFTGGQAESVTRATQDAMTAALAPLPVSQIRTRAASVMRPLPDVSGDGPQVAYLAGVDDLASQARLVQGRWPAAGSGLETVLLESTAQRLGVMVGDQVQLGKENLLEDPGPALTVDVVGVAQPVAGSGWEQDPLQGAGFEPGFTSRQYHRPVSVYGPFLLDPAQLLSSGAGIDRLAVTVTPDLSDFQISSLFDAQTSLVEAETRLETALDGQAAHQRVVSGLPDTVTRAQVQQTATRSTVLVVVVLGVALSAAALGLAAQLMLSLRQSERVLLEKLGAGRRQLLGHASIEALLLAGVAGGLAVPLSSLAHYGLTRVPRMSEAGMAGPWAMTATQVSSVLAGALLLAGVLIAPSLRPWRPDLLTRTGADLILLVLAGAGWWQLSSQPDTPPGSGGVDAVRVLAPVLFLVAGAAGVTRLIRLPLRLAERRAAGSTGLVWPLAVFEASRRPRAVAAVLLVSLACAGGTFALGFGSTWERSQVDQAAMKVGADLRVDLVSRLQPGQAQMLAEATGGSVTGVTDREVALGTWTGSGENTFPRLVALDADQAGALLTGRAPPGQTWDDVGALLDPPEPVLAAPTDEPVTLRGSVAASDDIDAAVQLVMQEGEDGPRITCELDAFPLDGRPHTRPVCLPGARVVAVHVSLGADEPRALDGVRTQFVLDVSLPVLDQKWTLTTQGEETGFFGNQVKVTPEGLQVESALDFRIGWDRSTSLDLVLTPFEMPWPIPAVISERMAEELQMSVDDRAEVRVDGETVWVEVAGVVPAVPSAPAQTAVLVDADNLSRVLLMNGRLDPVVDSLWVTDPARDDVAALNLGTVRTWSGVSAELSSGPLRIGLPAGLWVILPVAVLLALTGTLLHVTADVQARAVEISRLRGLGLTRREIRRALLAQHGTILSLVLFLGALVGAAATFAVGPALVRSDLGTGPVPTALVSWPWGSQAGLLGLLLIGSFAVVLFELRRVDAAQLGVER